MYSSDSNLMRVQIFIASSLELKPERQELAYMVSQLNVLLEGFDIYIRIVKWEYVDSSMSYRHKQEDYNDELKNSDLCFFLFWTRLGIYTQEELNLANSLTSSSKKQLKVFYLFKDSSDGVSQELSCLQHKIETDQHFSCSHFSTTYQLDLFVTNSILLYIIEYLQNRKTINEREERLTSVLDKIILESNSCSNSKELSLLLSQIVSY